MVKICKWIFTGFHLFFSTATVSEPWLIQQITFAKLAAHQVSVWKKLSFKFSEIVQDQIIKTIFKLVNNVMNNTKYARLMILSSMSVMPSIKTTSMSNTLTSIRRMISNRTYVQACPRWLTSYTVGPHIYLLKYVNRYKHISVEFQQFF